MTTNPQMSGEERMRQKVLYPELSYRVVGLLFEAHRTLGRFAREAQYGDVLEGTLTQHGLIFERERIVAVESAERHPNRIDFLIEGSMVVELKAKPILEQIDFVQVHRYLDALRVDLGLLVNFRERFLRPRRLVRKGAAGVSWHS